MQSIGQNTYLKSNMSGMMLILPVTIMSSVATLVKVFPFAPYQDFLLRHNLTRFFDIPITFTNNFGRDCRFLRCLYASEKFRCWWLHVRPDFNDLFLYFNAVWSRWNRAVSSLRLLKEPNWITFIRSSGIVPANVSPMAETLSRWPGRKCISLTLPLFIRKLSLILSMIFVPVVVWRKLRHLWELRLMESAGKRAPWAGNWYYLIW